MAEVVMYDLVEDWGEHVPFSSEEQQKLKQWYMDFHGENGSLDLVKFAPWMIEHDARALKQYFRFVRSFGDDNSHLPWFVIRLMVLHFYTVTRNERGILYEIIGARRSGVSKAEVMDILRFAYVEGGLPAMNAVPEMSQRYLDDWADDSASTAAWPDGWAPDPDGFALKLDRSTDAITSRELAAIKAWYAKQGDSLAPHVDTFAALSPATFKAYLIRKSAIYQGSIPAQLVPLLTVVQAAATVRPDALRSAVLAAVAIGATDSQIVESLWWGLLYSGQTGVESAYAAIGDILNGWAEK